MRVQKENISLTVCFDCFKKPVCDKRAFLRGIFIIDLKAGEIIVHYVDNVLLTYYLYEKEFIWNKAR